MSTRRYAAHAQKAKQSKVQFVNHKGHHMSFDGKLTLKQLMQKGVTHIQLVKPDAPMTKDEWRSTP